MIASGFVRESPVCGRWEGSRCLGLIYRVGVVLEVTDVVRLKLRSWAVRELSIAEFVWGNCVSF